MSKVSFSVVSSTASNSARFPLPERVSSGGVTAIFCASTNSCHHQMMFSVVHASPSDHFRPLRNRNVHSDASSLVSQDSTSPGTTSLPSFRKRSGEWP